MMKKLITCLLCTFSVSVAAVNDIADLQSLTDMQVRHLAGNVRLIVKFDDASIRDALVTSDRVKHELTTQGIASSYHPSVLLPSADKRQQALAILEAVYAASGLKLHIAHTYNDYAVVNITDSQHSFTEIKPLLLSTGYFSHIEEDIPVQLHSVSTQSINLSESAEPLYHTQYVFGKQSRFYPGAASGGATKTLLKDVATLSSRKINVAIIDTGRVDHEDIIWADGADMLYQNKTQTFRANCGSGDEFEFDTRGGYSPWGNTHGLGVAGVIGAISDNNTGIAGLVPSDKINLIPVLAVDECGGNSSSIAMALLWALGELKHPDYPPNTQIADVINISAGGYSPCFQAQNFYDDTPTMYTAIEKAISKKVLIVASAGNERADAGSQYPANCPYVITAGAIEPSGYPASFTNYGSTIDIMALGNGVQTLVADNQYGQMSGTSFSAPIVAALAALMKIIDPSIDYSNANDIIKGTAQPLGAMRTGNKNGCDLMGCGAGAINFEKVIRFMTHQTVLNQPKAQHIYADSAKQHDQPYLLQVNEYADVCQIMQADLGIFNHSYHKASYLLYGFSNDSNTPVLMAEYPHSGFVFKDQYQRYAIQACDSTSGICTEQLPLPVDRNTIPAFCKQ